MNVGGRRRKGGQGEKEQEEAMKVGSIEVKGAVRVYDEEEGRGRGDGWWDGRRGKEAGEGSNGLGWKEGEVRGEDDGWC